MIQPNLKWYTGISGEKRLSPRCPFASVHTCPRYYASVSMLGEWGIATQIDPREDKRLLNSWKRSDLWPMVAEQDTGIAGAPGKPSMFSRFCPEVSFERFGWFGSFLAYHADEIDADAAHRRLGREGASGSDWRWGWSAVTPMHYSECPLYSPLSNTPAKAQMKSGRTILQRYRLLGLWGKLAAWGSVASIIGLGSFFLPQQKSPIKTQANTVTSAPGATILQSARDIVINSPPAPPKKPESQRLAGRPASIQSAPPQAAPGRLTVGKVDQGPCSVLQIGGQGNQASGGNCGSPEPKIAWKQDEGPLRDGKASVDLTLSVDHSMEVPAFYAICDRPCETIGAMVFPGLTQNFFLQYPSPNKTGFGFSAPRPLGPGVRVIWTIRARDGIQPFQVTEVQKEKLDPNAAPPGK